MDKTNRIQMMIEAQLKEWHPDMKLIKLGANKHTIPYQANICGVIVTYWKTKHAIEYIINKGAKYV